MNCVFNVLGGCTTGREQSNFKGICSRHAEQIFKLKVLSETLTSMYGTKQVNYLVSTKPNQIIVPFPFKITPEADNTIRPTSPLCQLLQHDPASSKSYNVLSQFVSAVVDITDEQRKNLSVILMGLFSNGFINLSEAGAEANVYMLNFQQEGAKAVVDIQNRWKDVNICVERKRDGIPIREWYPMVKLPLIYQILFFYAELSEITLQGIESERFPRCTFIPNIVLDLDLFAFRKCNESTMNPIYFYDNKATKATPLILCGAANKTFDQIFSNKMIPDMFKNMIPWCRE